ncbi:conserved hypothetical protein [Sporisorium reilianum SRZ2]|uniref:Protein YOP1 n=1 Tax=Sporisorium reilianum (strain SRZ2) TaxID=999809 RepID=E6ZPB1_SPORE|nr:conserved hypothetical protein [Sporisorium reilianum SRZ2]
MALLILHLPTLALNATATLVYPLYSSYKAVTSPTTPLAEMEVWLVYWSVFACWTLFESLFGFLWSWMPFYYELRLLFNVWLVAPQTRGATYVYTNHLHPFLQSNQEQIDVWIEEAKRTVRARVDHSLGGLWSASLGASAESAPVGAQQGKDARHKAPVPLPGTATAPAPPTQHNPAQAPLSLFGNLVKTYAPVAIASARNFLDTKAPPPNVAYSTSREDAMHRRCQLETQLAALDASGVPSSTSSGSNSSAEDDVPVPVTVMGNPGRRASAGAGTLRNRVVGKGTVRAGAAMGESYDLLDQNDLAPLQPSPAREAKRNWMPWSPKD